ncbi:hypothetical protein A5707_13500 [Mycobacterium kyorinense]|uniref:SGNH hydrolase-type esterase domain-containing protein n=1 Tax=Mycobacterium kyorinense TaxID=487514 RepID=A0A1A2ZQI9_9MYCO|nr:GDSL lipase [Mycobacterium kyorinense]OBI51737.1 hypothetical protein A5707_13500 [Mycobacterium kyorinense]
MGRLTSMVVALAFAFGILSAQGAPPRYQTSSIGSPVNHVAVIGDSYTNGTDEGGLGSKAWTARTWLTLGRQGLQVAPDVASEGRAGYGVPGDHGSLFRDLTARAVHPNDVLVVFFGSRNDQGVNSELLAQLTRDAFDMARHIAPAAKLLVIGPPWPTTDPPDGVLEVRDVVAGQARAVGATFVDPINDRWFVDRPDLIGADGVHPTDAGHAYMAEKIAPLIRAQLPKRN